MEWDERRATISWFAATHTEQTQFGGRSVCAFVLVTIHLGNLFSKRFGASVRPVWINKICIRNFCLHDAVLSITNNLAKCRKLMKFPIPTPKQWRHRSFPVRTILGDVKVVTTYDIQIIVTCYVYRKPCNHHVTTYNMGASGNSKRRAIWKSASRN